MTHVDPAGLISAHLVTMQGSQGSSLARFKYGLTGGYGRYIDLFDEFINYEPASPCGEAA